MSRSPTLTLVVVFVAVFVVELAAGLVGVQQTAFALAPPVTARPWTLVTSVYAHASVPHLVANSLALGLVGLYLERTTSRVRFHAFFLASGVLSGIAQVVVAGVLGRRVAVLGASGAVFALVGYLLAGNRVTESVLGTLPLRPRTQLVVAGFVAAAITVVTAGRGVALVAHFAGLVLGLVAGRAHLLRS